MENVNWLKLKLERNMMNLQSSKANINADLSSKGDYAKNLVQQTQDNIINQVQRQLVNPQQLRMNNLASIDRAVYVKNLLNLPKNMVELLVMVQNDGKMPTLQNMQQNQTNNPVNPNQQNLPQNQPNNINPSQQNLSQNQPNNINPNQQNLPQNPLNTQQSVSQNIPQNSQVQIPEQPQVQQQQRPRNDNELPYKQGNQNQNQEKFDNLPQRQINADKEAFQQQLNTSKDSLQVQKQIQQNQQINQNVQRDIQNRVTDNLQNQKNVVLNQQTNNQTARITQGQEFQQPARDNNVHNNKPQPTNDNGHRPVNQNIQQNVQNQVNQKIQNNIMNNVRQNIVHDNNVRENVQNNMHNSRENILNSPNDIAKQPLRNNSIAKNNIRHVHHMPPQPHTEEPIDEMQTNAQKTQNLSSEELAQFKQKLASQLNETVNLSNVSALLQKNSKMAMNKMVSMMTMATAQGMTDIKPLQDTVNIINASVAANSQNDSIQTLKNLMLLYLPWLPLQEGVGFDLDIEQDVTIPESDTFIKILITTVNYGNLNATVSLISGNSVDIGIICSEKFPKKELFRRLQKDSTQHSMQSVIDFQAYKPQEQVETVNPKAKVNLSNVNQVNPYLLLMSHAIIRHTIELDATISIGTQPLDS